MDKKHCIDASQKASHKGHLPPLIYPQFKKWEYFKPDFYVSASESLSS